MKKIPIYFFSINEMCSKNSIKGENHSSYKYAVLTALLVSDFRNWFMKEHQTDNTQKICAGDTQVINDIKNQILSLYLELNTTNSNKKIVAIDNLNYITKHCSSFLELKDDAGKYLDVLLKIVKPITFLTTEYNYSRIITVSKFEKPNILTDKVTNYPILDGFVIQIDKSRDVTDISPSLEITNKTSRESANLVSIICYAKHGTQDHYTVIYKCNQNWYFYDNLESNVLLLGEDYQSKIDYIIRNGIFYFYIKQ